jgi:hypothetical protein
VRVGHERSLHGGRQAQRGVHLGERALLGVVAPGGEGRGRLALGERARRARAVRKQPLCDLAEVRMPGVLAGVRDDGAQLGQRRLAAEPLDRAWQGRERDAHLRPGREPERAQLVPADARAAHRRLQRAGITAGRS